MDDDDWPYWFGPWWYKPVPQRTSCGEVIVHLLLAVGVMVALFACVGSAIFAVLEAL